MSERPKELPKYTKEERFKGLTQRRRERGLPVGPIKPEEKK